MIFGNRIPKDYFITSGIGESDVAIYPGAFDKALKQAGIENCNIITYTSILPKEAKKIREIPKLEYGCVLETIMARQDGKKGERLTAGLIIGWIYKNGEKIGGLVSEYNGNLGEAEAKAELRRRLEEMFKERYGEGYELKDVEVHLRSFIPQKKFGCAIVAICFVTYAYPEA